ncbi:hypothetical protein KUCAC02_031108, partial [Chaenocephalus aceratus]
NSRNFYRLPLRGGASGGAVGAGLPGPGTQWGPVAEAAGSAPEIFADGPCCLAPLSALTFVVILEHCLSMSSYKHKSGATKRKEKDKKEDQKAKLSKLDGYFFRPTPPPAGDQPEVVATASGVSSPSPSPPTTLAGVSQMYSDNRDDKAAASCSSREPGLTLDQPHPSPSDSLPAAPQGEEVLDTGNESSNRHRYGDIIKAVVKISLTSDKKDERNEASALKNAISKFRFLFLVNMQTKILESINCASQLLQAKDADILKASTLLQNAISVLVEYRGQFDEAKSATLALATKWGSQTQFETTRARKVKRHFEDSRLTDAESNFRVTVFNACLDIIIQQLSQRFTSLNATVNMFEAIHPNTLLQAKDEDLHQAAQRLREHYSRDIAASFPGQLLSFRTCFRDQIPKLKSVADLVKMLIVYNPAVTSTFSEVCTAFILFLTLPVTVATAERSSFKLKLIKNYLRSTMGQERLSGLALLSIESDRAKKLDIQRILDEFAERKARRVPFE